MGDDSDFCYDFCGGNRLECVDHLAQGSAECEVAKPDAADVFLSPSEWSLERH